MEDTTTTSAAVVDAPVTTSTESSVSASAATTTTAPDRPTSMLDALQKADQGQVAPQSTSSTTGQPATPQGPIPFDVHKTALDNARTKAAAEALRGLTPEQFNTMAGWWQRAQQDTNGFLTETLTSHPQAIEILQAALTKLNAHPTFGPQLKSLAAKALASARGNPTPKAPEMVKVQLEDGSVVAMPRDPAAYLAYHQSQWEKGVGDKLAPITQTVDALKAEHDAAVHEAQIDHFVTTTYEDVKTWPGMQDASARTAVAQALQTMQVDPNDPRAVTLALNAAYRQVVLPTLSANAERTYAASLKQKAAAQIESASTSAAAPMSRPKNPHELAKYLAALEGGR
jgi:hypothetical protein